jgi:hypothetical protein
MGQGAKTGLSKSIFAAERHKNSNTSEKIGRQRPQNGGKLKTALYKGFDS